MRRLAGRRVLITGGGRGIGAALAWAFARAGAVPLISDREDRAAAALAARLREAGCEARAFACDVSDPASVAALRDRVHREVGGIHVLVNNAGLVTGGAYERIGAEADQRMLAVNVRGVHLVTKAFLPDLQRVDRGHLVWMASAAGLLGVPDQALYCASKWFVIGLAEALRAELREHGFRHVGTTIVCPSFVDTGMFAGVRSPRFTRLLQPEALAEKVVAAVRRDRLWVREPWLVKITPPLRALLPTATFDRIAAVLGVTRSMRTWRGHAPSRPLPAEGARSTA